MNGINHIFRTATANQSCRACVDSLIPELARLFIDFVFRENKIASEICREILEINANGCVYSCHVLPLFVSESELVNPRMNFHPQRRVFMFLAFPSSPALVSCMASLVAQTGFWPLWALADISMEIKQA